jgi:hypothetical protein
LDSRDPVLPRIIAAIQPLVLPKLREENERLFQRKKGKPVKDVVVEGKTHCINVTVKCANSPQMISK